MSTKFFFQYKSHFPGTVCYILFWIRTKPPMLKNGPAANSAGDRKHRLVHPQRSETLVLQSSLLQWIWKTSKISGAQALGNQGYWLKPAKLCRVRTRWHSWKPHVCMWRYTVGTNLEFLPPCFATMIRAKLWAGRPKEFGLVHHC